MFRTAVNSRRADGPDTANVRWRNKNASSVDVWIDEEESEDRETDHIAETVGYIAIGLPAK
jgi:hypothetical protein